MRTAVTIAVALLVTLAGCGSREDEDREPLEAEVLFSEQPVPTEPALPPRQEADRSKASLLTADYEVGELPISVACGAFKDGPMGPREALTIGFLLEDQDLGGDFTDFGRAKERQREPGRGFKSADRFFDATLDEVAAAEAIDEVC